MCGEHEREVGIPGMWPSQAVLKASSMGLSCPLSSLTIKTGSHFLPVLSLLLWLPGSSWLVSPWDLNCYINHRELSTIASSLLQH